MERSLELRLREKANWARRTTLDMAIAAGSGHVTTAFSLAEIFAVFYGVPILNFNPKDAKWPERDRFILSEGQAGIGLYPFLADVGYFPVERLQNFCGRGATLGVHSEPGSPGVEVLTGSLGWGLSIGTGMADFGKRFNRDWKVIVLTGDGELSEGSNWEALFNIARWGLNNLTILVNRNHQFTIGFTDRIELQRDIHLDPIEPKFQAFGLETRTINGHDVKEITQAFSDLRTRKSEKPLAIIADTTKGHGCFLANQRGWHFRLPKGDDLKRIKDELEDERRRLELALKEVTG